MRPGARARRALASLTIAVVLGGGAAACESSSGGGSPPSIVSIRALLARHARAVLEHSSSAFLADLDGSTPAREFRDQQAADIANLASVPLTTWTYTVTAPVRDAAELAAASRRYGAPSTIVEVSFAYQLQTVDPQPSSYPLWLSFTQRHGRTYLAGDQDLAADGAPSWLGPWQYGPIAVARGQSCLVLGPAAEASELPELASAVDAAVPAVTAVWGTSWSRRVAVVVASDPAEFAAAAGSSGAITDVSAVAVTDGIDPVSGQPYGQRLVLNPGSLAPLSAVGQGIVLRHEITHLATAASTSDTAPRWVVEGFAEYVANLTSGQPVPVAAAELRTAVDSGEIPSQLPSDSAFDDTSADVAAQAYEQAWLACRLIAARAGPAGLTRFYRLVGMADTPAAAAVSTALATVMRETPGQFTVQWRAYLQAEVR